MNHSINRKAPKGFTLVELLVVIAIIAVLAALAFPAVNSIIRNAKITESEKVASDLVFSINAFEDDYNYLPYVDGSAKDDDFVYKTDDGDFLAVLMGQEDDVNTNEKEYFSADQAKNGINGLVYTGASDVPDALIDGFGNPYEILVDYDRDGKLNTADFQQVQITPSQIIRSKTALILTPGANEGGPGEEIKENYLVKTW